MDAVIVDPAFPGRLREYRRRAGLSVRQVGRLVHYSHTYVWEVETGRKAPTRQMVARLDDVLATGGVLAGLLVDAYAVVTGDDLDRLAAVVRRPEGADVVTLATLAALLDEYRRREDQAGAAAMLPAVGRHVRAASRIAEQAGGRVQRQAVYVAGQWAQFAGWLATAAGRQPLAERRFGQAAQFATVAGDRDLAATVLSFRGYAAWLAGRPRWALALTEAALREPGVYVGQRAYDAYQAAQVYALVGDRRQAVYQMAAAGELVAAAGEHEGVMPPWHYYRSPGFFALEQGRAWCVLGRDDPAGYRRAVEAITSGLAALPADQRRAEWVGDYLCDLARAQARIGDRTGVADTVRTARSIATATRSRRLAERVDTVSHRGC